MRKGSNPQKKDFIVNMNSNHRIIMVVFIPELKGYYLSMFEVVKLSIKSLLDTIPNTSKITIVDNGSCKEVQEYLVDLVLKKNVDSIQLLSENIGKIDALMGVARGAREPIITLADCDILFKPNWVFQTISIFNAFKNVSSVSPIPSRRSFNYYTYSTKEAILKGNLKFQFEPIKENHEEFNKFLESINWDIELEDNLPWPVVQSNNEKAIVGSDHQVLTIRRDILFNNSPKQPSLIKVGSGSEQNYVDFAIDSSGGLRLSTYNFYALHMGNILDDWMLKKSASFTDKPKVIPQLLLLPRLNYITKNNLVYKIKKKLIKYVFKIKNPSNY